MRFCIWPMYRFFKNSTYIQNNTTRAQVKDFLRSPRDLLQKFFASPFWYLWSWPALFLFLVINKLPTRIYCWTYLSNICWDIQANVPASTSSTSKKDIGDLRFDQSASTPQIWSLFRHLENLVTDSLTLLLCWSITISFLHLSIFINIDICSEQ